MNPNKSYRDLELKTSLRNFFLNRIEEPIVLDLYCGNGEMFKRCYLKTKYQGIDRKTIHDEIICTKANNQKWVQKNEISYFNFIDLDSYANPYPLLFQILSKTFQEKIEVVLTDGVLISSKLTQKQGPTLAFINNIPRDFKIPLFNRFYKENILTLLLFIKKEYGYNCTYLSMDHNPKQTTYYIGMELKKQEGGQT